MSMTAAVYQADLYSADLRLEVMYGIDDVARARREQRRNPGCILRAIHARAVEALLLDDARELWPDLILTSFEDVVCAYDRSLH